MASKKEIRRKIKRLYKTTNQHRKDGNNPMVDACLAKIKRLRALIEVPFVFR